MLTRRSADITLGREILLRAAQDDLTLATSFASGNFILSKGPGSVRFSIAGKVITPDGLGLRNADVKLTAPDGSSRTVTSSSFGIYSFDDVPGSSNYMLTVASKRYRFAPRTLTLEANLADINLIGLQ